MKKQIVSGRILDFIELNNFILIKTIEFFLGKLKL